MTPTFTPEVQPYEYGTVQAVDLPFDFKNKVTTWQEKYGITEVPLLVKSADGQYYDDKKFKGIFKNNKYTKIVGRNYTVLPNEEVREMLNEYIAKTNSGLEIVKEYTSHHGDAMFWQVHSKDFKEVKKGDEVQIGCVVRNSVGTYVALGADLFTYRLICKNGAIAKGQDLGSIAVRHIGHKDNMLLAFGKGIETIIQRTAKLVKYYKKSTEMTVDQRIAEEWAKRIPQRALPQQIEVETKSGKVVLTGKPNLWDSFNDITANAWKDQNQGENMKTNAGFLTKYHITQHAHKVLIGAVDGTLGKASSSSSKKAVEAA